MRTIGALVMCLLFLLGHTTTMYAQEMTPQDVIDMLGLDVTVLERYSADPLSFDISDFNSDQRTKAYDVVDLAARTVAVRISHLSSAHPGVSYGALINQSQQIFTTVENARWDLDDPILFSMQIKEALDKISIVNVLLNTEENT